MTDIVERLRCGARFATDGLHRDLMDAADEIERLRASNDQRGRDLATVIAQRDAAEQALQTTPRTNSHD